MALIIVFREWWLCSRPLADSLVVAYVPKATEEFLKIFGHQASGICFKMFLKVFT